MSKDTATPSWDDLRAQSLPNRRDREDAKREQQLLDHVEVLKKNNERLREALEPFRASGDWGKWLAWLTEGAPTRDDGLLAARSIVWMRAKVDEVLRDTEAK